MPKVDMSAAAVTNRLKRVSQLRRLGLSLRKAKIRKKGDSAEPGKQLNEPSLKRDKSNKE